MTATDRPGGTAAPDRVADATDRNWVDRFAPAAWRPYLRLSRVDRPAGTWLLLLPCWWGLALAIAADGPRLGDLWIAAGCALGALLMRGAGCTWNDLTDRDIDAEVARTRSRPLPSGAVTPRQAFHWAIAQSLAAAVILFTFHPTAIWLGIGSLGLVAIYPYAKRFTWWPQVFLGLAFNWGALLAYAAHAGRVDPAAVALYAAGIAWTLFYDTIYAHQDKEDDALIGVRSTARLFGDATPTWLVGFLVASVMLMLLAGLLATLPGGGGAPMLAILAAWAFGAHLVWQLRVLDIDRPETCLMVFRSNRDAGLIAAALLAATALLPL